MSQERKFEGSMEALEKIVEDLSAEDIGLEASIEKYKEGMALVQYCNKAIDKIEKELIILNEGDRHEQV